MIQSFNDKIRNIIFKDNNILNVVQGINSLDLNKKEVIIKLLLSDYYKINFITDEENLLIFNYPLNFLLNLCCTNYIFFKSILFDAKSFYDKSVIEKIYIMEELEEKGMNVPIGEIYKLHILDTLVYRFVYDLDYFKKYHMDYINRNKNIKNNEIVILGLLADKLGELKIINYEKYRSFILEFLKTFYKWNFYNINNNKTNLSVLQKIYLSKIDNNSIGEIYKEIENNSQFLNVIMKDYFDYTTNSKMNENEINEFLINHGKKDIQKKLKINKDLI